jgi:hypothetical protein
VNVLLSNELAVLSKVRYYRINVLVNPCHTDHIESHHIDIESHHVDIEYIDASISSMTQTLVDINVVIR